MKDTLETLARDLRTEFAELQDALGGKGAVRGTHEAVLFEAQGGAIIGGKVFDHLQSLTESYTRIAPCPPKLETILGKIGSIHDGAMIRTREVLRPLIMRGKEISDTLQRTQQARNTVIKSDSKRFHLVCFSAGERIVDNLVSNMLKRRAGMLRAQSRPAAEIPETELLPPTVAGAKQLLDRIRTLPISLEKADEVAIMIGTAARSEMLQAATRSTHPGGQEALRTLADAIKHAVADAEAMRLKRLRGARATQLEPAKRR